MSDNDEAQPEFVFGRDLFIERWGPSTMSGGFVAVPNALFWLNRQLPLNRRLIPSELVVLIVIMSYWWTADTLPFPSIKKISYDTGISIRHVKRIVKSIEKKGFMEIVKIEGDFNIQSNMYDLRILALQLNGISSRENLKRAALKRMRF